MKTGPLDMLGEVELHFAADDKTPFYRSPDNREEISIKKIWGKLSEEETYFFKLKEKIVSIEFNSPV